MIAQEKRNIILSYGTDVNVYGHDGSLLYETKALIGKGTKQAQSEESIEYHRQAQFTPEIDVPNGAIMYNLATGHNYLAVATMTEVYNGEKLSNIVRFLETNATVTITTVGETADEFGNITTSSIVKVQDTPAYITLINAKMEQFKPGLFEQVEYLMYLPDMDIDLLDKVTLKIGSRIKNMKVETVDYLSYVGVVLVGLCSETRK